MLIDTPQPLVQDAILAMISDGATQRIDEGLYQIGHFGSSHFMRGFEHFPDLSDMDIPEIGVCDYPKQVIEKFPELIKSERQFVICFHQLLKKKQSPSGGWRWHKWGEYIGDQNPTCEYLYDEAKIEEIWTYHIYEKL